MSIVSPKRVYHLARYFGVLAILCILAYQFTGLSYWLLTLMGPPLYLTYLLRVYLKFLSQMIPNEPFFNNLVLFFPLVFIYFGLIGFQIKNILNERGKIWTLVLQIRTGACTRA